jgi:hypothetical protein
MLLAIIHGQPDPLIPGSINLATGYTCATSMGCCFGNYLERTKIPNSALTYTVRKPLPDSWHTKLAGRTFYLEE